MGFGGGGSGGGDAQAREDARQGRVKSLQSDIRARFFQRGPDTQELVSEAVPASFDDGSGDFIPTPAQPAVFKTVRGEISDIPTEERKARFADIEARTRNFFIPDFNEDTRDAQRELGFALARRGTFSGSAELDAQKRLNDQVRKGERLIGTKVAGARSAAESADERLINSLLNEATADPDAEGLLSGIKSSQLVNADQALANAQVGGIENVFANVGSLFKDIRDTQVFNQNSASSASLAQLLGRQNQPFAVNSRQNSFGGTISN